MAAPFTYSFLDTHCAIVGPGGTFSMGTGDGVAEEGITIDPAEEIDAMTIGADGSPMHSLIANKSGKVTVRLLKTSPTNQKLAALVAFQRLSAKTHGLNTISIANTLSGDLVTCQYAAFSRVPRVTYAKEGGMNEWEFNVGIIDVLLGAGVAAA